MVAEVDAVEAEEAVPIVETEVEQRTLQRVSQRVSRGSRVQNTLTFLQDNGTGARCTIDMVEELIFVPSL